MPRATRSFATAAKSSNTLCRFSFSAWVCHCGPYSPPPRMLAITYVYPRSSHARPTPPLYAGTIEFSNPP